MEWFVTKVSQRLEVLDILTQLRSRCDADLYQGASIDSSTRIEVKQLAVPVKEEDMGKPIPVALYCCEEDEAPERYGTSGNTPTYTMGWREALECD